MKKIIIFLLILFLGMQSTQVHSLQKAKGALLVGLSLYCYKKLLPSLFSWVKHPGKQYSNQQEFKEFDDGSAQWIVYCTNNEGELHQVTLNFIEYNNKNLFCILAYDWTKYLIARIFNDHLTCGASIPGLPGFTIENHKDNDQYIIKCMMDCERIIVKRYTSKNYIFDPSKTIINKIDCPHYSRLLFWTHAAGLGVHNISNWACVGVGIYGGIKLTGII